MRRLLVLILLLGACGSVPAQTIEGTVLLRATGDGTYTNCYGADGFDDIAEGASVKVHDEMGKLIATSRLGRGYEVRAAEGSYNFFCQFEFSVQVPGGKEFYTLEISNRGELTYSVAELDAMGWTLTLSLGE